tara:strand:+ start:223 stop:687 length:465 start_codon:yes stop_codon:yes gene_type:complete
MEFLLFLNSKEEEILKLIQMANVRLEENTPLCSLSRKYFGFFKKNQNTVVICTDNAKIHGGYFLNSLSNNDQFDRTSIYIRRALRHESVHVTQKCNNGNLLDLSSEKKLKFNPYKLNALKGSSKLSGNKESEYQAYLLEDKPNLIIKYLKIYCL